MSEQLTWTNAKRKLSDLVPWERNPRQVDEAQRERLAHSWDKFGQVQTLAIGPNNELYDGHQREKVLSALDRYGPDYEVDVRVSSRPLTEKERQELTVLLVKASGDWDWAELGTWDQGDLLEWGFEENEFQFEQPKTEVVDAGPQIDKAGELQEQWGTALGQIWELGEHRLVCGDCTDERVVRAVMGGAVADSVFTDPPYGMEYKGDVFGKSGISNDAPDQFEDILRKANALMPISNGVIAVCFGMARQDKFFQAMLGRNYHRALIIYKPNRMAKPWHGWILTSEMIHLFSVGNPDWQDKKHSHDVYTFDYSERPPRNVDHPTVKPLSIVEDVIYKSGGNVVYDPFLGSGTTIIACERLNRKCRAIEIEPKYVAVTLDRWSTATGKIPELVGQLD